MGQQVDHFADDEPFVSPGVVWMMGGGTAALGGAALLGWALEDQLLKQLAPDLPSMRPTAAVCLILLGIAVIMIIRQPHLRWVGYAATVGAALIAGVSLLEYLFDRELLIDRLLFRGALEHEPYGGRMALSTAVALVLMVSALLAVSWRKYIAAQCFGLCVFTGGAVAVLGYAYGERRLYAIDAQTGMALNTALGLTFGALGLLAAIPDGVLSHLLKRPAPGALLSRRLLPWTTIAMPIIGWLQIEGERRNMFGSALGTSIMVFAGSVLVTVIARLAAVSMDRLAWSLNHAWHQYGLASASEQTRIASDQTPQQLRSAPDRMAVESEADFQRAWPDR